MNFKSAILAGTIGGKIETKVTQSGLTITTFGLFVSGGKNADGSWKDGEWFSMVAFDKAAQFAQKHAVKGAKLMIECTPRVESWTDKNGNKASRVSFTCRQFHFTGTQTQQTAPQSLEQQAENEFDNFNAQSAEDIAF